MSSTVEWVVRQYPAQANHPMFASRQEEFNKVRGLAKHYGIDLTLEDFEAGVAERFGDGCEYEWPRA